MNLLRKIPKLLLTLVVLLPASIAFAFTDVSSSNPHNDAIQYLQQKGVTQGYSDGSFRPDSPINRAEFLKILLEAKTPGTAVAQNLPYCFPDVADAWYAPYVCYAKSRGIVSGYPDGNFHPANNINLAEALKMVLETYEVEVNTSAYSQWYEPYYWAAESNGWLDDINRDIEHLVTRGEMAQLIWGVEDSITIDEPSTPIDEPQTIIRVEDLTEPGPLANSKNDNNSCDQNTYELGIILLYNEPNPVEQRDLDFLESIKLNTPKYFAYATEGKGRLNVGNEIYLMETDFDGTERIDLAQISQNFYETYPDLYDFLIVYKTYRDEYQGDVWYRSIWNNIHGMEINLRSSHGNSSKLLGITNGGQTDLYIDEGAQMNSFNNAPYWTVIHEIGHQWCCSILGTTFGTKNGLELLAPLSPTHINSGLETKHEVNSIMGAASWTANPDGTFQMKPLDDLPVPQKYHSFELYLMGLLEPSAYGEKFTMYDTGDPSNPNLTAALPYKQISVNDIIDTLGPRTCEN